MSKRKLGDVNLSREILSLDVISPTEEVEKSQEIVLDFTKLTETELCSFKENPQKFLKGVSLRNYDKLEKIKDIKANLIGQFTQIKGTVVKVSQVLQKLELMNFICSKCAQFTQEESKDGKFSQGAKCSTFGCKGKLYPDRSSKTKTKDWQKVLIQEKLYTENSQVPKTIEIELNGDLVDSVVPGDVATVSGIVKVLSKEQGMSKGIGNQLYQLYIDVHSIEKVKDQDSNSNEKNNICFSIKDLYGIREIKDEGVDTLKLLVNSFCPKIFGQELVKLGILLVLFGGRNREDNSGVNIRSQPHILIVGDPGLGKSQLLSETVKVAPRGVYVYGDTATAAGLTVNVCKDPDSGDLALEAGALVLVYSRHFDNIRATKEFVVSMNLIK
jgi:DNA helicase MCM8